MGGVYRYVLSSSPSLQESGADNELVAGSTVDEAGQFLGRVFGAEVEKLGYFSRALAVVVHGDGEDGDGFVEEIGRCFGVFLDSSKDPGLTYY